MTFSWIVTESGGHIVIRLCMRSVTSVVSTDVVARD